MMVRSHKMLRNMMLAIVLGTGHYAFAQYNVDRLLLSGRIALHYEDFVLSIQYFNQAISQKPYLWEPWQLRAIAKYNLGDWQGTDADATQAIERNKYITSLYDLRGIARIKQNNFEGAIDDYTRAIALDPSNRNYWYNRAACFFEKKDYDAAQLHLDTLIEKWQKFAAPYLLKAETYLCQKDSTAALEWIGRSLEIDPYNAEAWRVRGALALQRQEWENADEYLSKALHLKPKNVSCLINRALVRLRLNNLRGSMEDYDTALDTDPNNFLGHYNRGLLRQQVGDYNHAIEDFNFVLGLEPDNMMALFNRATLYDRIGNLKAAIADYSRVIEQFPNFWTGLHYRAACYRRLGMVAKAEMDEFRILKAQMDKHLGKQQRWSRKKLEAMRKMSDFDPDKYNNLVIEDEISSEHEYKSEFRGKVQNRRSTETLQSYVMLTMNDVQEGLVSYTPFDKECDVFIEGIRSMKGTDERIIPRLGINGKHNEMDATSSVADITLLMNKHKDEASIAKLLLLRSIAYSSVMDYDNAIKDANTVLTIDSASVLAVWQRAVCNAILLEYEETTIASMDHDLRVAAVVNDFLKLIEADPDNTYIVYCLGTFLAHQNRNDEAISYLTKCIGMDVHFPLSYYNRGIAYLHNGDLNAAKADFSKAGELGLYNAYSLIKNAK